MNQLQQILVQPLSNNQSLNTAALRQRRQNDIRDKLDDAYESIKTCYGDDI